MEYHTTGGARQMKLHYSDVLSIINTTDLKHERSPPRPGNSVPHVMPRARAVH